MDKAGEVLIDRAEQTIGTSAVVVGSIDPLVCHGKWHFLKRSTGDTIYIAVGSKQPGTQSYHIILTDEFPAFTDNVVIGDVRAVCSDSAGLLSTFARGGFWESKK